MTQTLLRLAWRLAACAAAAWAVWRFSGLIAMLMLAPLAGLALARPLLDLAGDLRRLAHARIWRTLEGRHFAFRGIPVQVLEDAQHRRWVRAADVRRILGPTASDGAFALSYPDGWCVLGQPPQPHFSDAALLAHLAKQRSPEALRLRRWVEREIAYPARRVRERLGIRADGDGALRSAESDPPARSSSSPR